MTDDTLALIERFRDGDADAAQILFDRYVGRLLALARDRLSAKLTRRIDPEDVVQSAYRSFFVRAREGNYTFERSGDLWRLLAAITINKLRSQIEHHTAGKRAINAEHSMRRVPGLPAAELAVFAREPAPDEAAALVDRVNDLMTGLDDTQRRMLELRLQGYQIDEIAAAVGRSERGVRRTLDKIKIRLEAESTSSGA